MLVTLPVLPHSHHQGEFLGTAMATSSIAAGIKGQGQFSCSEALDWLTTTVISTVLSRVGSMPTLLSAAACEAQDEVCRPADGSEGR